jgi:hypothetical protein
LILLADRIEDRIVLDGTLGCPNCRDSYPVRDGFGDLRAPPRAAMGKGRAGEPGGADPSATERLAALLGVAEGPGTIALVGGVARHADGLAGLVPGVEIIALDADMAGWEESPRVSRLVSRPGLPLYSRTLRGVGLDGALGVSWIQEAARVTARLGRVVVEDAPPGAEAALGDAGLSVLASDAGTIVAARA